MWNLIVLCLLFTFNSFAQEVPRAKDITWNKANHPYFIVQQYTRIFRSLPLFGRIKTEPWSGDYGHPRRGKRRWDRRSPCCSERPRRLAGLPFNHSG